MSTERKVIVSIGVICLLTIVACIIFSVISLLNKEVHNAVIAITISLGAFWIAEAVAKVLKGNPEN